MEGVRFHLAAEVTRPGGLALLLALHTHAGLEGVVASVDDLDRLEDLYLDRSARLGYGHGLRILPTLMCSVSQAIADEEAQVEEPLMFGDRIRCPWCEVWAHNEAFTELQTPPNYPNQCGVVLKHGGQEGCKQVFSIRALVRPPKAIT